MAATHGYVPATYESSVERDIIHGIDEDNMVERGHVAWCLRPCIMSTVGEYPVQLEIVTFWILLNQRAFRIRHWQCMWKACRQSSSTLFKFWKRTAASGQLR